MKPSIINQDDVKSDPELERAANLAYENSRTGPYTILPCAIAYCPLAKVVSPEFVEDIGKNAKKVAQETGRLREKILGRQFEHDSILGQLEYIFDSSNWSPFFKGEEGKKYATMLQVLQYPFTHGSAHVAPNKAVHQRKWMRSP